MSLMDQQRTKWEAIFFAKINFKNKSNKKSILQQEITWEQDESQQNQEENGSN